MLPHITSQILKCRDELQHLGSIAWEGIMEFEEMTSESLDEGQDSEVLITTWNWHHGTWALTAAHSPGLRHRPHAAQPRPTTPKIPPPQHCCCSPHLVHHPSSRPQREPRAQTTLLGAHLPEEKQMGRHELGSCSRDFETSLASPVVPQMPWHSRRVPEGFGAAMGVQMGLGTQAWEC